MDLSLRFPEGKIHTSIQKAIGIKTIKIPEKNHDPKLAFYLEDFIQDAKERNRTVDAKALDSLKVIKYVDKLSRSNDKRVVATCNNYFVKGKKITLERYSKRWREIEVLKKEAEAFSAGNEVYLRMLLYHELFHCLYHKGHLPDVYNDKKLYGIMSETLSTKNKEPVENWHGMLDELFLEHFDIIPGL